MIEVFSSPNVDRGAVARKMLVHVFIALAAIGSCVAMLFISIGKDSEANRDAIHKTTSAQSEMWLVISCIVMILAISYISIVGYALANKIINQFSNWVYYKGKLYYIAARVPYGRSNTRRISRIINIQDKIIHILNDKDILIKIIEKEVKSDDILVEEVENVVSIKENKYGLKVRFNRKSAEIRREVYGYDRLFLTIKSLVSS